MDTQPLSIWQTPSAAAANPNASARSYNDSSGDPQAAAKNWSSYGSSNNFNLMDLAAGLSSMSLAPSSSMGHSIGPTGETASPRSSYSQFSPYSYNNNYAYTTAKGSGQSQGHGANATASHGAAHSELERTKLQLSMKNQIIANLKKKIELSAAASESDIVLPNNFYKIFRQLAQQLADKKAELDKTNELLEAILVSLSFNDAAPVGGPKYDEQDLAYKMVSKINQLKAENLKLLALISSSSRASLLVEVGMLRQELAVLKRKAQ